VFVQRKVLRKSRKVQPQSAPPDCGFSTSATPKEFGAISPAGISANNYKIVMISQDNFLIIFQRACIFLARLCFKGQTPGALQRCGIRV
jgi:hypothetical protein